MTINGLDSTASLSCSLYPLVSVPVSAVLTLKNNTCSPVSTYSFKVCFLKSCSAKLFFSVKGEQNPQDFLLSSKSLHRLENQIACCTPSTECWRWVPSLGLDRRVSDQRAGIFIVLRQEQLIKQIYSWRQIYVLIDSANGC